MLEPLMVHGAGMQVPLLAGPDQVILPMKPSAHLQSGPATIVELLIVQGDTVHAPEATGPAHVTLPL